MTDPAPSNPKKRLPYGLIGSIVLNGLLIGLVIGVTAAGPKRSAPPSGAGATPEQRLAQGVFRLSPGPERRALRRDLRQAWASTRVDREAIDQARQDLAAALIAEPFDPAAIDDAFGSSP
ncbi:MAG: periplasmic heavy metal sensor [Pseudomonadota bacterium]